MPESDTRSTGEALGHDFAGGLMCQRCELSLQELQRASRLGRDLPPCPGERPEPRTHSGNKYHRAIKGLAATGGGTVTVDVYSVLTAFPTGHPGCDHAVKKILCAGIRGKGSRVQDLREARDALTRAVEDAEADAQAAAVPPAHA
jgi:hypothetical protein